MKIPDKIKIGGHYYTVRFPYVFKERVDIFGQCDHSMEEIRIAGLDSGGSPRGATTIYVSLLHEILHAIDATTGHETFFGPEGEQRCVAISEGLFQVLRDNDLDFRNSD